MQFPKMRGVIDRRILVNFQIDKDVLARVLPPPFQPKLVGGVGIGGICLIRLKQIRPQPLPAFLGVSSENAAHRIAVEWKANGIYNEGVYIPRRDTSSRLNTLVGGRLFPGVHHHATFDVEERPDQLNVGLTSDDGETYLRVRARPARQLPAGSAFSALDEASCFFEQGSLGYSDTGRIGQYDGLELRTLKWELSPLAVDEVESSFFSDRRRFPRETVTFDCALLMRGIEHEWHSREPLYCDPAG